MQRKSKPKLSETQLNQFKISGKYYNQTDTKIKSWKDNKLQRNYRLGKELQKKLGVVNQRTNY